MIARYAGICAKCGQTVNVGDSITWSRKHRGRVLHIDCPKSTTTATQTTNKTGFPDCPTCHSSANVRILSNAEYRDYPATTHRCMTDSCDNYFAGDGTLYTAQSDSSYKLTETKTVETDYNNQDFYANTSVTSDNQQATVNTKPLKVDKTFVPTANDTHPTDDLSAVIAQAIARYLPQQETTVSIDESAVRAIVAREIASIIAPTVVTVARAETGETRDMGVQHKQFPLLLSVIASGCNVWMSGPAGSGKTTAADNVSQALDKKFYFCGAQSNEYGLLGFRTATGDLVRTPFREAYEHGGVFLFDEIDASAPTALLAFNAALANGWCAFPDGMIRKHADFIVIAAANTFGLGGTNDYVGRMKQDAAFIDRFVFLGWDVDEALESATCGNTVWAKRVQKVRAKIKAKGIKCIVSPRASYYGAKLLAQGIDQDTVETLVLRKGLDQTAWESIS